MGIRRGGDVLDDAIQIGTGKIAVGMASWFVNDRQESWEWPLHPWTAPNARKIKTPDIHRSMIAQYHILQMNDTGLKFPARFCDTWIFSPLLTGVEKFGQVAQLVEQWTEKPGQQLSVTFTSHF